MRRPVRHVLPPDPPGYRNRAAAFVMTSREDILRVIAADPVLSNQEVPAEVDGCDCGGLDYHRAADWNHPGCAIWRLPHEQAQANVDDTHRRLREHNAMMTARLHAALGTATCDKRS
jgi:hypothetical protein